MFAAASFRSGASTSPDSGAKLGKKLVTYVQTDNLIIKSNGMGDLLVSVDGELERADWLEAVMEPKSIKFIVPKRIEN